MNQAKFFAGLRSRGSGVFGTSLSQAQVDGVNAILASCARHRVTDIHHVANIMAQVYHETGGHMLGIKETVYASHKDKNPSDATVKARLESAWKAGKLSWVRTPYWRDGWFGRGPIQITHKTNYERMGKRLGVNLVGNPSLALDANVGADIAVVGMSEGMFTGKRLSNYRFPTALDADADNPRRIVNGKDGTDAKIAGYHRAFHKALSDAGYAATSAPPAPAAPAPTEKPVQPAKPAPSPSPAPTPAPDGARGLFAFIMAAIVAAAAAAVAYFTGG